MDPDQTAPGSTLFAIEASSIFQQTAFVVFGVLRVKI